MGYKEQRATIRFEIINLVCLEVDSSTAQSSRTYVGAGGILDKNYTVATDIGNNQKLSLRTKGSSLLLFRAGEHPCAALLGLNGKGTVIVESKSNDVLFFQKDIPGKFCIFYDDTTQTFVVQNNYGDARTVTLRVIPF